MDYRYTMRDGDIHLDFHQPSSTEKLSSLPNGHADSHLGIAQEPVEDAEAVQPLPVEADVGSVVPSTVTMSAYQTYPTDKPFVYDSYRRDTTKPVKAYPESNRQAVMTALKSLQEKIRSLEIERSQAENNLKTLSSETTRFRDMLQRDPPPPPPAPATDQDTVVTVDSVSFASPTRAVDIKAKLDSAEHRCKLLEKQLDCMRNMVQNAEYDRSDAMRKSALLSEQRALAEQDDVRRQIEKISELERDHLKLTATQTIAENKIRELEEKLREERHHRKFMQTRAAELETAAEAQRIMAEATALAEFQPRPKKTKKKRKASASRKKVPSSGNLPATRPYSAKVRKFNSGASVSKKAGTEPPDHYKLNLGQIPFISGKSTTPSHSLTANFQEVLSLMKAHNPRLCKSPRNHAKKPALAYFKERLPSGEEEFPTNGDLTDLLMQLQDEFGHLSFEHQELNQQIQSSTDARLREDLERELDALVSKMEQKGQQIARLRRHQDKMRAKQLAAKRSTSSTLEVPVRDTDHIDGDGQFEVTTTIRTTKGSGGGGAASNKDSHNYLSMPAGSQASLNLYKGLKKIQNKLRRDDLSWD